MRVNVIGRPKMDQMLLHSKSVIKGEYLVAQISENCGPFLFHCHPNSFPEAVYLLIIIRHLEYIIFIISLFFILSLINITILSCKFTLSYKYSINRLISRKKLFNSTDKEGIVPKRQRKLRSDVNTD